MMDGTTEDSKGLKVTSRLVNPLKKSKRQPVSLLDTIADQRQWKNAE